MRIKRRSVLVSSAAFLFLANAQMVAAFTMPSASEASPVLHFWVGDPQGHPLLSILSDGTVLARLADDPEGPTPRPNARLTPAALETLVASILKDHRFLNLSTAGIEAGVDAAREGQLDVAPMDFGVSQIELVGQNEEHSVSVPGSAILFAQYPSVKDLERFRAIELALLDIHTRAMGY